MRSTPPRASTIRPICLSRLTYSKLRNSNQPCRMRLSCTSTAILFADSLSAARALRRIDFIFSGSAYQLNLSWSNAIISFKHRAASKGRCLLNSSTSFSDFISFASSFGSACNFSSAVSIPDNLRLK